MPTVCASVPMHAPTTTNLRPSAERMRRFTSCAVSSGNARSVTVTADMSTRWLTRPYTMKNVKSGPDSLGVHDHRRVQAHLARRAAAPRLRPGPRSVSLPNGTGSVNDTCTRPSPVVSPYGRIRAWPGGRTPRNPPLRFAPRGGPRRIITRPGGPGPPRRRDLGGCAPRHPPARGSPHPPPLRRPLRTAPRRRRSVCVSVRLHGLRGVGSWPGCGVEDLGGGVQVARRLHHHAVQPAAAVRRALRHAERPVRDRRSRPSSPIRRSRPAASPSTCGPAPRRTRPARGGSSPPAARRGADVAHVLQGQVTVGQERRVDALGHHADQQDRLVGHQPAQVEERVQQVAGEDVAGHVLGRRHVLQRRVREQLADQLRVRQLEQERVRHRRVDLERVPEPELRCRPARPPCRSTRSAAG